MLTQLQSKLSGEVKDDSMTMFAGDNVLQHFQRVFGGRSHVMAVSGDQKVNSSSEMERNP